MVTEKSCNVSEKRVLLDLEKVEVEPAEEVQMNIYQSNTDRTDSSWLHFYYEPRVQQRQLVKDQQSRISVFVTYLTVPSSN